MKILRSTILSSKQILMTQAQALLLAFSFLPTSRLAAETPVLLKHSDVVMMYKTDFSTYTNYAVNLLGWGQEMTPENLKLAGAAGVKVFGSVGVITECGGFYDRFPNTYEQGWARDLGGKPSKVAWLATHKHKEIPFYWCCIRNPEYRQFLRERVVATVNTGVEGIHLDDHMGTAGAVAYSDLCFCNYCVDGFRAYLKSLPTEELNRLSIVKPDQFDFRETMKEWVGSATNRYEKLSKHPLWPQWLIYQCRGTVALTRELKEAASQAAGRALPMCANACLLVPRHLIDYQSLDLFSSETYHNADKLRFSDTPVFAYRLAEAVNRPYAATARGVDWAVVKERNLIALPSGWIALAYASGQFFMPPTRSWCFTPEKGTHWYQGPTEKFAPLYQFIRRNADLFDEYQTFTDIAVVLPYGSFNKSPNRWFDLCNQLAATNLSYRLLVCGDGILERSLTATELKTSPNLFVPDRENLLPADRELVEKHATDNRVASTVTEAIAATRAAVQITASASVRAFPRVKKGAAVIHLLNYDYDGATDTVRPLKDVRVIIDTKALGIPNASSCNLVTPDAKPVRLKVQKGTVEVPTLGLWSILSFENR